MNKSLNKIAQVVVGLPVDGPFDYSVASELQANIQVGQRVRVSFNRKKRTGYVVGFKQKSSFRYLLPVLEILDQAPCLDKEMLAIASDMSAYYGCSMGEAIDASLPSVLRRNKKTELKDKGEDKKIKIVKAEAVLVHDPSLIESWDFILEQVQKTLLKKKKIIFLVPEVRQIDEIKKRMEEGLKVKIAVMDSRLKPQEELAIWVSVREGESDLVMGTRSAVFAPVDKLGLIVIYDEENQAFKQQQSPHYHAQKIAQWRTEKVGASFLCVSSAPSAEIWSKAKKEKWTVKPFATNFSNQIKIVDMSNYNPGKTSLLSFPLQHQMQKALEENKRVVLFLNQRADTSKLMSKKQSEEKKSSRKSYRTTLTRLENNVAMFYPYAKVALYDKETKKIPDDANIIIATQAILRLKNQLNVSLIAVILFDTEFTRFDYRSACNAFSLLVHLRQMAADQLIIQTRLIDNYCLKALKKVNFSKFYREELKLRKEIGFPPFSQLISINVRGKQEDVVLEQSQKLYEMLKKRSSKNIEIFDPQPDSMLALHDRYRFQILLKGTRHKPMVDMAKTTLKDFRRKKDTIVSINVDP